VMCRRFFHYCNVMLIPRRCLNIHHKTRSIEFGYQSDFQLIRCNKFDVVMNVSYVARYTFLAQAYDVDVMTLQFVNNNYVYNNNYYSA
jgi:hypothetical protein